MISQIVSVASFFVCWIVATRFGSLIAPTIPVGPPWNQVLAMAIIFFVTLIAIRFAYAALEAFIKHWHLKQLNTFLGGLLGLTKGLLLCLIITFFAVMFSETSRAVVFKSKTGIHLVHVITRISLFVPQDSYEFVHTQFAQFNDKVDDKVDNDKVYKVVPGQTAETLVTALSQWWEGDGKRQTATESEPQPLEPQPLDCVAEELPIPAVTRIFAVQREETDDKTKDKTDDIRQASDNSSEPTTVLPTIVVEDFYVQRPSSQAPTLQLMALTPLAPLTPLTEAWSEALSEALSEAMPMLSEVVRVLPEVSLPSIPVVPADVYRQQ
jgi:uncharacterized membrane protein required for colicin V production